MLTTRLQLPGWIIIHRPVRFRGLRIPAFALGFIAVGFMIAWSAGYRINSTPSEPVGIWHLVPVTSPMQPVRVGEYISFCAPTPDYSFLDPGNCDDGVAPFLKRVVGVPGDLVKETAAGVKIDGHHLPQSKPLLRAVGYPVALPQWRGQIRLKPHQYWVYGSGWPRLSYDSRYYGPVSGSRISAIARPVWIWRTHVWLPL